MDVVARVAENLAGVRGRIAEAARRSGRSAEAISLVAVTKYVNVETTDAVAAAGCLDLGESRPQSLWTKAAALGATGILPVPKPIRWHLVGHLQRNKIRRTLPLVHLIQSVDSRRLLDALDEEAAQIGQPVAVLLEANISGDVSKTGLPPEQLASLVANAAGWSHVAIRGLMGMASLEGGGDAAQRDFERLRLLRDRLAVSAPPVVSLAELSMGMSGDFEIAIAQGATIVRIGSALFEGVAGGAAE
ncbi:MAG: YggS family pyridoxal phosphate-dependent enzyme [Pirellulales bacterium]